MSFLQSRRSPEQEKDIFSAIEMKLSTVPYTLEQLRKKHPRFIYKSFRVRRKQRELIFDYEFVLEPDIVFKPRLVFHNLDPQYVKHSASFSRVGTMPGMLRSLAFYLGFAEIFTYWKAACPPEIVIECVAYATDPSESFVWFLDLLKKGMGEFFYTNNIDFRASDFVKLTFPGAEPSGVSSPHLDYQLDVDKYLVPIGGGKDAIVTLETLKRAGKKMRLFFTQSHESGAGYCENCCGRRCCAGNAHD